MTAMVALGEQRNLIKTHKEKEKMNMSSNSLWIRESIKNLKRIRDVSIHREGYFRMDRNERTWPHNENILNSIRNSFNSEALTNYTEMDGLYHKLANYLGLSHNQIYFHSGSDLVIKSVFETFIDPGDKVLIQNPSYAMYKVYSRMYGADLIDSSYDSNLNFNTDDYCKEIEQKHPKMVVLENPSGYVGNSYSLEQVKKTVETAKKKETLILVDEAYIDYIPEHSAFDLLKDYDNLIIVRTFSKAWGLAGIRAGYAISNPLLISELFQVMPMHELTTLSVIAVDTALDHAAEMGEYIEEVKAVRSFFQNELDNMGIRFINSDAHFVTACLGEKIDANAFRDKAFENRYIVRRPFEQGILKNWVRIGLLPMDEMKEFVEFLKDFAEKG